MDRPSPSDEAEGLALAQSLVPLPHDFLHMWTITEKPKDFPNTFVAREWKVGPLGVTKTERFIVSPRIEPLRCCFQSLGLVNLGRHENDDPVIVETWV